jgi:homoserine O-acetyltransferase
LRIFSPIAAAAMTASNPASPLAAAGWSEGLFRLTSFTLESGETIAPLEIAYATIGTVKDRGANALLLLPSASGKKESALAHAIPGGCADPDDHFVISVDPVGGGGSSRPSQSLGPRFPAYSIRDNALIIHRLLTEGLGLDRIKAAGGPSMGAMIALELALHAPDQLSGIFLWSPSSHIGARFPLLTTVVEAILGLSASFRKGALDGASPDALRAAGLAYFPSLVGKGFLERRDREERAAMAALVAENFAANWNAHDLLSRYRSLNSHDVRERAAGRDDAILQRLDLPCLLMPCPSDLLLTVDDALEMRRQLPGAVWRPIRSDAGHWAASQPQGTMEHRIVTSTTRAFLRRLG